MRPRWTVLAAAVLLLATLALAPEPVNACATLSLKGELARIVDEEAIIVWDSAQKTEHFVRRATIAGAGKDLGFLVPVPTVPTLVEADDRAFERVGAAIQASIAANTRIRFDLPLCGGCVVMKGAAAPGGLDSVRVLDAREVAGYDSVVLEADAPDALAAWLARHGYDARPAIAGWLEPYVRAKWKLAAFKLARPAAPAGGASSGDLTTRSVRLSFQTDRPFFPYREPADQGREGYGRALRVFLVGATPLEVVEGPSETFEELLYKQRRDDLPKLLEGAVPASALPASPWLVARMDRTGTRENKDVYFGEDSSLEEFVPHTDVHVPLDVVVGAAFLVVTGAIWLWRRRRRRAAIGA